MDSTTIPQVALRGQLLPRSVVNLALCASGGRYQLAGIESSHAALSCLFDGVQQSLLQILSRHGSCPQRGVLTFHSIFDLL